MGEQNIVYTCSGILFSPKRNITQIHAAAWVNHENMLIKYARHKKDKYV
jgi:hypothetical protein